MEEERKITFYVAFEHHMDRCNASCLDGQLAILVWENLWTLYVNSFLSNFSIPAMHIGTADFAIFTPLSLTLTLPGLHKVSAKKNFLASFSCTLFN